MCHEEDEMLRCLLSLFVLFAGMSIVAIAQDEDNARGIFIRTRKTIAQRQATPPTNISAHKRTGRRRRPAISHESTSSPLEPEPGRRLVALGYTLYLKNEEGRFVSVNPNRIFRTGQAVRLMVESNVNGYLYVFHQENDGPPKMMFPCSLAWDGDNHIQAHKPLFISPLTEIRFTGNPATEVLTLVVSRNPLPAFPLGYQLASGQCNTPVSESAFNSILREHCQCSRDERVREGVQMPSETVARDMEMLASDPAPNHIVMNRYEVNDRLITRITLIHH
jgi:Domain of unknown function (DUF4384)